MLFRRGGDEDRAEAISCAVCTSDARVAAGWPYSEENDSEGDCVICWWWE